jgi:hypothetical protein
LNGEFAEVALMGPLFPTDVTLDTVRNISALFSDPTIVLSFDAWSQQIAPLLKLNEIKKRAIYSTLACFTTRDAAEALIESRVILTNPRFPWSRTVHVTDILVFLYAVFVKKRFRGIAERSNYEAFPMKPAAVTGDSSRALSKKTLSRSTPQVSPGLGEVGKRTDPVPRSMTSIHYKWDCSK